MRPHRRLLAFALVFSVLPAAAALFAATFHTQSQLALTRAVWEAAPGFVLGVVAQALGGSLLIALLYGAASLWAWGPGARAPLLRTVRFALALWTAAYVLYPGLASWVPVLRDLPWWLVVGACVAALAASCAWRPGQPGWRELALTGVAVLLFFFQPEQGPGQDLRALAHRGFDGRDVILLGFDSVSYSDIAGALERFEPSRGTKLLFQNAWTPGAVTGAAWRSALSGSYPTAEEMLPGRAWPTDRSRWLPAQLRASGYEPVMMQDTPHTNTFGSVDAVRVPHLQGWKSTVQEFVWKAAFPLSVAGARWWVLALGGPADTPGRYAYCPRCFWSSLFARMGAAARDRPLFWASHSCYMHEPVRLSLLEAARIPGWWRRPPHAFEGAGNPFEARYASGTSDIGEVRLGSVRQVILDVLTRLDQDGVLGAANVILFSDHGPRGAWASRERTNHVMLAMFLPGPRRSEVISTKVSLVDIAPTIRRLLKLEPRAADGLPLPLAPDPLEPAHRVLTSEPVTAESVGINPRTITSDQVMRAVNLFPDGSFELSAGLSSVLPARSGPDSAPSTRTVARGAAE